MEEREREAAEETTGLEPRDERSEEERKHDEELEREGRQVQRAVFGPPIVVPGEPSVGTEDTPPPTEEVLPIHPGGWTKPGPLSDKGPVEGHELPHMVPADEAREERPEVEEEDP